jgi:hypothetical protein
MPLVMRAIAEAVESRQMVWRATFSELARWWRFRAERKWLVIPREGDRVDIQFDEWNTEYALALDIERGNFRCSVPVTGPRMSIGLSGLVFERRPMIDSGLDSPVTVPKTLSLKHAVQAAIDWETVTPIDDIPRSSIPNRVKRGLRWWKLRSRRVCS